MNKIIHRRYVSALKYIFIATSLITALIIVIQKGKNKMTKKEKIQEEIWEIEREYPNLHIDLHRDQFKSGDIDKLHLLYNQLEEIKNK